MKWPASIYTESHANALALDYAAYCVFGEHWYFVVEVSEKSNCFSERVQQLMVAVEDRSWRTRDHFLSKYFAHLVTR